MKLIIGIGNPGEKYKLNRHNVGHMLVDLLNTADLPGGLVAKKTDTFMNDSGESVKKLMKFCKVDAKDLYIVHDDLDIPLGQYKIQFKTGPKIHNGLLSIEESIGTNEFWRVRIGVDNRPKEDRAPGDKYVLADFTKEEFEVLKEVLVKVVGDLRGL